MLSFTFYFIVGKRLPLGQSMIERIIVVNYYEIIQSFKYFIRFEIESETRHIVVEHTESKKKNQPNKHTIQ